MTKGNTDTDPRERIGSFVLESDTPVVGQVTQNDIGGPEELARAYEESIKSFEEGDIVAGKVVQVDKDEVLLDIGYKSEGVIPARELTIKHDIDPRQVVNLGDEIEALVTQKEDKEGRLILSKKKAQYERAWGQIEKVMADDSVVNGTVIEVVKGGLIVDIGLRGFLPASLVDLRRVRDLHPCVGKKIEAKIIELDRNRNNVVLSRRKYLEEAQSEGRKKFLEELQKGEVRKGTVSSIVNFGAFVDLGGVDGLVHVSELSWKHIDHPSEVVEVGQEVEVEVLDVDLERERVSLSLKATQEDPWRQFARSHEVGEIIEGRVTKLVPFGAFVEVDDAIEGPVNISKLRDRHVERAEDEVRVHDRVPVKIIDIDLDRRRISLSRKQAMSAPAAPAAERVRQRPEIELEPEAEMEVESRRSSEAAGVATEHTLGRSPATEELTSAAESAPEIARPGAPESIARSNEAARGAPAEEREEAEVTSLMSPDAPPEGPEGVTAAESDTPSMEVRISQEEREPGAAPGESVDEVAEELEPMPTSEGEPIAGEPQGEPIEPEDKLPEDSI